MGLAEIEALELLYIYTTSSCLKHKIMAATFSRDINTVDYFLPLNVRSSTLKKRVFVF